MNCDGLCVCLYVPRVSPFPAILHQHVLSSKWTEAVRLCRVAKVQYKYCITDTQVNKKDFQGNQKDVGMVEASKVSKQGKDCKGSYHCPVCHKQVPLSHITIPTYCK